MRHSGRRGAVFVDRDGVIVRNRPDYVKSWGEVEFIPGALNGLRLLAAAGQRVFVITNQSAVGRGLVSRRQVDQIHGQLSAMVRDAGGLIEAFLVCPHRPQDACGCRKPSPGLLLWARDRFGVDLTASCVIGDCETDIAAAAAAGCRSILVFSGRTLRGQEPAGADQVADDLLEAARTLLEMQEESWQTVA